MNRIKTAKLILWSILGFSCTVMAARFIFGLGATTNLTDATPWGLWIGFDVLGGVALAAGGFVVTAMVYVMKREEFHPIVRPAVLTAFLGYLAVIGGLLFDLGLPWHIWHPVINWQHHSALFEVAWCVMLYTTVLALEFFPVPLEATGRFDRIRLFLTRHRLVLVILGIMLSTLHQSSLGSLFLIMPYRLPALWYTPILPVLFFISAVALGMMMVSLESLVTGYLYRREPETGLLARLGSAARWVLGFYLAVRLGDLLVRGVAGGIFAGTFESALFLAEISLIAVIPLFLLSIRSVRESQAGQWAASFLVVGGVVFNRLNVGGITMIGNVGRSYFPSWMEFAVSAGVVSAAALVFFFAVEHFAIWEEKPKDAENAPLAQPVFNRLTEVWLGTPAVSGRLKYSAAFVFAAALAMAFLPYGSIRAGGAAATPVARARGGDTLKIDGNDDGFLVRFDHKMHVEKNGERGSCVLCHHMNLPEDADTPCSSCHRDMFLNSSIFNHSLHQTELGGNGSCSECHTADKPKSADTVKGCRDCHKGQQTIYAAASPIKSDSYFAPGYVDAMHGLCISCHRVKAVELHKPDHARCTTCHKRTEKELLTAGERYRAMHYNSWVVTPTGKIYRQVEQKLR